MKVPLFELIIDGPGLTPANNFHGQGIARFYGLVKGESILGCIDRLAVDALDNVSPLEP